MGISPHARNNVLMVIVWDVWYGNRSEETRLYIAKKYPYMRIRFIPAGGTGTGQPGDTHLQRPYKWHLEEQEHEWYIERVVEFRRQLIAGEIDAQAFRVKVAGLLSLPVLRDKSVEWHLNTIAYIEKVCRDCCRRVGEGGGGIAGGRPK